MLQGRLNAGHRARPPGCALPPHPGQTAGWLGGVCLGDFLYCGFLMAETDSWCAPVMLARCFLAASWAWHT